MTEAIVIMTAKNFETCQAGGMVALADMLAKFLLFLYQTSTESFQCEIFLTCQVSGTGALASC